MKFQWICYVTGYVTFPFSVITIYFVQNYSKNRLYILSYGTIARALILHSDCSVAFGILDESTIFLNLPNRIENTCICS